MPRALHRISACLALAALAGCDRGPPVSGDWSTRDSAGVVFVDNVRPVWGDTAAWHLSAGPTLVVGVVDGAAPYVFSDVRATLRLSDGTLVVADGDSRELRFFSPDGQHVRSVGGPGEGPSEFGSLSSVLQLRPGDTIYAYDSQHRRYVVFGPDGSWVRTTAGADSWGRPTLTVLGWLSSGAVLTVTDIDRQLGSGPDVAMRLAENVVLAFERGEAQGDSIARVPAFFQGTGPAMQSRPVHFLPQPSLELTSDGFWFALPFSYELRRFGQDGLLRQVVRRAGTPQLVGERDMAQLFEEVTSRLTNVPGLPPPMQANLAWSAENMVIRDSLPAFAGFTLDVEGNLWVQEFAPIGALPDSVWPTISPPRATSRTVFNPEGRWLGSIPFPADLEVHDIGRDYVLGVMRDPLGVEQVQLYELTKP